MLGCGKHFPGLGEGKLDSHHELPVIEKSLKKLVGGGSGSLSDAAPATADGDDFACGVSAGDEGTTPASLSKMWITDILRKRIGYRNLIVSDDLEMGGVLSAAPVGEAAAQFVARGRRSVPVCHREDYVLQAHEELVQRVERDKAFARRCAESARRVLAFKKKWKSDLRPCESSVERGDRETVAAAVGVRRAGSAGASGTREKTGEPAHEQDAMIVAGVMSGTSADGINVALVRIGERFRASFSLGQTRAGAPAPHDPIAGARGIFLILQKFVRRSLQP